MSEDAPHSDELHEGLRRISAALESIDRKLTIVAREMDSSGPNGSALTMALGEIRDALKRR